MNARDALFQAARISNPWRECELPMMHGTDYDAIVRILLKNKVSFLDLRRKFGRELARTPLEPRAEAERRYFDTLRGEFERVRLDLEAHGVRTMLFKSTGLYPSFPHLSSNLDVLVEPGAGDEGRRRLYELGYIELLNAEEPVKYLFRRFSGDGPCFTFHLHEQVGWGIPFLSNERVWAGARPAPDDPAITIPSPRDALQVTLAHWFYEDKTLTLENLYLTASALRDLPEGIDEAASHARERGWEDGFYLALTVFDEAWRRLYEENGLPPETREGVERYVRDRARGGGRLLAKTTYGGTYPSSVPFLTNKVYWVKKLWRDRRRSFAQKCADFVQNTAWTIRSRPGFITQKPLLVTISGCDGSGKSVQARRLEDAFRTCAARVVTVWSRGASARGTGALIRLGKRLFGGARTPEDDPRSGTEAAKLPSRRRWLSNPTARALFSFAYAVELFVVYAVKVRWLLWTGHVVVCDRYVADAFVDFATLSGMQEPPPALRWLRAVSPTPHASYVLDVVEAEALRRKPEEGGTEHLAESRRAFKQLAAAWGMRAIAAHLSENQVHETLAHDALSRFYLRYRTLINALLLSNPGQMNPRAWRATEIHGA